MYGYYFHKCKQHAIVWQDSKVNRYSTFEVSMDQKKEKKTRHKYQTVQKHW